MTVATIVYALYGALCLRGLGHLLQVAGIRRGPEGAAWQIGNRMVWGGSYGIIALGIAVLSGLVG